MKRSFRFYLERVALYQLTERVQHPYVRTEKDACLSAINHAYLKYHLHRPVKKREEVIDLAVGEGFKAEIGSQIWDDYEKFLPTYRVGRRVDKSHWTP